MQIRIAKVTKRKLSKMPVAERRVLLLLGHATNEIMVLMKLILMLRKDNPTSQVVDRVEAGQIFILLRLLIGKLHEAWELYRKRIQADQSVRLKWESALSDQGRAAIEMLNKHFGKGSSPITLIRNAVSFHYADEKGMVEPSFQNRDETEPWEYYLSDMVGNSFYYASELVMAGAVLDLVTPSNNRGHNHLAAEANTFKVLCDTTIEISDRLAMLFGELIAVILEQSVRRVKCPTVDIGDVPKISEFTLPFFFDEQDWQRQRKAK